MKTRTIHPEPHHAHAVQFYRDEESLLKTLSQFVREGLTARQPVVIIATSDHRDTLTARLVADGVSRDYFEQSGSLWLLDACEVLASFMDGARPDPEKFRSVVGSLISAARATGGGGAVRTYGEMVDLLWRDGNPEGAIQLESLWNVLAASEHLTLLCGYAMGNFYKTTEGFDIGDVCHVHARVLPA
ncbi:MAG: MEDS domain-containing protein [Vicinamibacterales bacterium]